MQWNLFIPDTIKTHVHVHVTVKCPKSGTALPITVKPELVAT